MARPRLLWQLFPSILLIVAVGLFAIGWFVTHSARDLFIDETSQTLEARTRLLIEQVRGALLTGNTEETQLICDKLSRATATRFTVLLPDGRVVGDSEEDPDLMEPHTGRHRPEIQQAMNGATGSSIRFSQTLQQRMLYVAAPIYVDGGDRLLGVARSSLSIQLLDEALDDIRTGVLRAGLVVGLLLAIAGFWIVRRVTVPLEEIERGVRAFAEGDLASRIRVPDVAELGAVAEAINRMASEMRERIDTITRQRKEQEAILASMSEGILALDLSGRVRIMNRACGKMLSIDVSEAAGKPLHEIVRYPSLDRLCRRALVEQESVESDLLLRNGEEAVLEVGARPLTDEAGIQIGTLIVMSDVTRVRRLERIRRDFVANVSHELKTPATSILAAVETLREGAFDESEARSRFLGIIGRQAERLSALIEDLLNLSRIEQSAEADGIELTLQDLRPVLQTALQACEPKALEKKIHLDLRYPHPIEARISTDLIETALVNLLDNAIKYSPETSSVTLEAEEDGSEVRISVIDRGSGIEESHLSRIFERFYRVEKARSRAMGGTGLGLAIVRHVALAHNGSVSVQSTVGQGSTFRIHLPSPQVAAAS